MSVYSIYNGIVTVPYNSALEPGGPYTISFWTKLGGADHFVVGTTTSRTTGYAFQTFSGTFYFDCSANARLTVGMVIGAWNLYVLTWDGATHTLYFGGSVGMAGSLLGDNFPIVASGSPLVFGNGGDYITDIRIYSRCLSASEVTALNSGGNPSSANLNAHWPCTDGSGTTVTDSASGLNGTLSGGSWSTDIPLVLVGPTGPTDFVGGAGAGAVYYAF